MGLVEILEKLKFGTGANLRGTRFLSVALPVSLLFFCPALCASTALKGAPGKVLLVVDPPFTTKVERSNTSVKWHISLPSIPEIPEELAKVIRTEQGGIVVEIPSSLEPAILWNSEGIEFRWLAGTGNIDSVFQDSVAPLYPLGPTDKIHVQVYNVDEMNVDLIVDPKGFITFPVLNKIMAGGKTVNELQKDLEERLVEYVKEPQVIVQVVEYGSRYVNVLGEVQNPARIPLRWALRILDAISLAQGFTDKSGDIEIQRRMPDGTVKTRHISREDLLMGNKELYNSFVHDQDVINVLALKSVYVSGEVKNPGAFQYNKDMTLLRAVALAGGFGQWAKKGRVDILREKPEGGTETLHVDATEIERGKIPDVPLMPNDHVVVKERKFL